MKKKVFGITLVSTVILGLLAACGTSGGAKAEEKNDGSKDKAENITVWSHVSQPSQTVASWKESPFHTGLAEASGIDVNWEFPAEGTDSAQAFNLLLSDTDLPEVMVYNLRNDAESYINDGIIQDLTKLLPEKAPNYWKFLQENPDLAKGVMTDSGKYYGFGIFRESDVQGSFYGPMLRKDWLEEQKLNVPTNADEWEHMLQVFNDEYGAQFSFVSNVLNFSGLSGAFGAHGTFGLAYYIEDKKVKATQEQTEWRDYMAWLNNLYSQGLIDPDVVTMDDESLKTKAANDKVGATFNLGSRVNVYTDQSKANGKSAEWMHVPYPNQADGSPSASFFTNRRTQDPVWVVTTAAKDESLDTALAWLDFAYSEAGNDYWNFGVEGETYTREGDRKFWTDKILENELGVAEALLLHTGLSGTGLGVQRLDSTARTHADIRETSPGFIWDNENKQAREAVYPVGTTLTAEESKEAASIQNTIDTYISENSMKFMTGEKSLDEYEDFVAELKNQGLDRLVEIKQAAYDRYLER